MNRPFGDHSARTRVLVFAARPAQSVAISNGVAAAHASSITPSITGAAATFADLSDTKSVVEAILWG